MVKTKFQIHRRLIWGSVDPQKVHKLASTVLETGTVHETLGRRAHAYFSPLGRRLPKDFHNYL